VRKREEKRREEKEPMTNDKKAQQTIRLEDLLAATQRLANPE